MLVTSLDTKSVFAKSGEDEGKCLTVECDSRETSGLRRSRRLPDSDLETVGLLASLDIFLNRDFPFFLLRNTGKVRLCGG